MVRFLGILLAILSVSDEASVPGEGELGGSQLSFLHDIVSVFTEEYRETVIGWLTEYVRRRFESDM